MEHLNENCRTEVYGTFNKTSHSTSVNNIVLNVNGHTSHSLKQCTNTWSCNRYGLKQIVPEWKYAMIKKNSYVISYIRFISKYENELNISKYLHVYAVRFKARQYFFRDSKLQML